MTILFVEKVTDPEGIVKIFGVEGCNIHTTRLKQGSFVGYYPHLDREMHWKQISQEELENNAVSLDGQQLGENGNYQYNG